MTPFANANKFWTASEAWYQSRVAAQTKARGMGLQRSTELAAKEARWRTNAKKYMKHYRTLPDQLIRVDVELQRDLLQMMEAAAPKLVAAFDRHLPALAFKAWRNWPVSSGLSRSLVGLEYSLQGEYFVGSVRSAAPYTVFIKDQPHRTLIDEPGKAIAERIALEAIDDLARGV